MWTIKFFEKDEEDPHSIVLASSPIDTILTSIKDDADGGCDIISIFKEGSRDSRVTLAHLFSRRILEREAFTFTTQQTNGNVPSSQYQGASSQSIEEKSITYTIQPLHKQTNQQDRYPYGRSHLRRKRKVSTNFPPFILERTDIWCDDTKLHVLLKVQDDSSNEIKVAEEVLRHHVQQYLSRVTQEIFPSRHDVLSHVANTVMQVRLRGKLPTLNAVAFIANGSIMPRKSGASSFPMSSPPAIPFISPEGSNMTTSITIDMGSLRPFLKLSHLSHQTSTMDSKNTSDVILEGMIVPKGVTLIVGGGYHGKSTMLRTIACGVYNKQVGDGREFCVTDFGALCVRAEDGRYVNNTNVSAFISNLPTSGTNTRRFSTNEASGSTSQATNVVEALEMGATAMLVDEDISAANFMSRDGRMRALVMDESITPLLYRVNGIYSSLGVSSVVVVGGVGDWLDVPDAVIKLDKYVASDALEKARSISYQFSHNHVQYGGRGVVHRLQWEEHITPQPRRITNSNAPFFSECSVSVLEGGGRLELIPTNEYKDVTSSDVNASEENQQWTKYIENEYCVIDMTKCEQLVGNRPHLLGCGFCVCWLLDTARQHPEWDIKTLLDAMDTKMDEGGGILGIVESIEALKHTSQSFLQSMGFAYRPRRYEVAMALTRVRGITFQDLPNDVEKRRAAELEEERKRKQALADLWAQRRKGKS